MKKLNRIIAAAVAPIMVLGTSMHGVFAESVVSESCDNLEIINTEGTAKSGNLGAFWYDVKDKQAVSVEDAKNYAKKYSSLSEEGARDLAVKLAVTEAGSSSTPFIQRSGLKNTNLYEKGRVRVSFNVYVDTATGDSHAPIQAELRSASGKIISALASFRTSKQIQFNASNLYQKAYSYGNWYNMMFDIDTVNKTYIPYVNGDKVYETPMDMANKDNIAFAGDPSSDDYVDIIRFSVNGANKSKGSAVYIDDLYVGDVVSNSTEEIIIDSLSITSNNEAISEITPSTENIGASAVVTYSEKTAAQPIVMYAALYDKNWMLKEVCKREDIIPQSQEEGDFQKEISMPIEFTGDYVSGDKLKLFMWTDDQNAMTDYAYATVTDGIDYALNRDFEDRLPSGVSASNTADGNVMETSVTNDLGDVQNYAYKMVCKNMPTSGLPFITITPSRGFNSGIVNVDFKLNARDKKHARTLTLNGKDQLIDFRPTGEIKIAGVVVPGTFTNGKWHEYHITLNIDEKTFEVSQDENPLGSGTFTQSNLSSLRLQMFRNNSQPAAVSETYIDDIKIY